jgi:hypothetical protein
MNDVLDIDTCPGNSGLIGGERAPDRPPMRSRDRSPPAARLVAGILFGVAPLDPVSIAAAVLVLSAASLAAAYVPAKRAAPRLDPMVALRHE